MGYRVDIKENNMNEETVIGDGSIETRDLRLATWLYLNGAQLTAINPVETNRCTFTFTLSNNKLGKLMNQWANGYPTAEVREVINAYLFLVHRGKETIRAKGSRV
jgi:hypothetical protein